MNKSLVLSVAGAAGVIFTALAASKATLKAEKKLSDISDAELTKFEKAKIAAPIYIPTVLIGAGTIVCIFGSHSFNKRQQALLTSAYALLNETHKEYVNKVKDICGEETHQKIINEIQIEKCKDTSISHECMCEVVFDDFSDIPEETILFYDSFSKRYFESTLSKVLLAEYHLNRNFCLGWIPSVNDFYDFLGLEHTDIGKTIGWTNSDGDYYWIDFINFRSQLDDGLECIVIDAQTPPTPEFLKDR